MAQQTQATTENKIKPSARFKLPDEISVIVVLITLVTFIGIIHPNFINPINLVRILGNTAFWGMLSLGMVFLLATGEIDISIGWMFNFSAVFAAKLIVDVGIDPWLAALGGVLFGAFLGLINGLISVGLNIPTIIVTLGTLSVFRGLSLVVNESRAVVPDVESSFFDFLELRFFGVIPVVAVIFLILAVVLHLVLQRTRFGYRVQAIGSNRDAARLVGIPIGWVRVQTLVLLGALCGLSGAMFLGFRGAIDPTTGGEFMLIVIAAAIIGGTPLTGGTGTVIGAFVGALIIAVINSGIIFFGVDITWSTFVTGAVILLAVTIDTLVKRQRDRRSMRIVD